MDHGGGAYSIFRQLTPLRRCYLSDDWRRLMDYLGGHNRFPYHGDTRVSSDRQSCTSTGCRIIVFPLVVERQQTEWLIQTKEMAGDVQAEVSTASQRI